MESKTVRTHQSEQFQIGTLPRCTHSPFVTLPITLHRQMAFDRNAVKQRTAELAAKGVWLVRATVISSKLRVSR